MSKYDVGIFGWWYNMNYGANLTYFALNRAIQNMGYSVVMLWRSMGSNKQPNNTATRFAAKHYNVSPVYRESELPLLNSLCNTFVLGSDQLWNPDLERVAGKQFFLSFADPGKGRVAYAQSLGNERTLPTPFVEKYDHYIKGFDGISVREEYAKDMMKSGFGIDAPQVCDPVFLIERQGWDELIEEADFNHSHPYILNFFLDPNSEKFSFAENISDTLSISDKVNFTDLSRGKSLPTEFENTVFEGNDSIENLVKAYKNADFIITDSFHGTCLAIILNKPFLSIANYNRGAGRFKSLLSWVGLENKLVTDVLDKSQIDLSQIDYRRVNSIIEQSRENGLFWIKTHLKGTCSIPRELGYRNCVGCGACISECPVKALELKPDIHGYYRANVDQTVCIDCKRCLSVCPALNLPEKENLNSPQLFAFQASDYGVLERSSSGGVFQLLAESVIDNGGFVVGVAWSDGFSCKHIVVDNKADLYRIGKSKYFQSFMGDIDKRVKLLLDEGKQVLFSGCPCQVAGLKKYLKREYENLLLVDILCGNAPSSLFFKKYAIDDYGEDLEEYTFRYKALNEGRYWNPDTISAKAKGKDPVVKRGGKEDAYQRVYHNHTMTPYHCEHCSFQRIPRFGDLTIGDFWGIERHKPELDARKGISAVLCNNRKGEEAFNAISSHDYAIKEKVPLNWLGGNGFAVSGHNFKSPYRDAFYNRIVDNTFTDTLMKMEEDLRAEEVSNFTQQRDPLIFNYNQSNFIFEREQWTESRDDAGRIVLSTRQENPSRGHFAYIPFAKPLEIGKRYKLYVRFMARSDSDVINMHVMDKDNSNRLQIIHSVHRNEADSQGWLDVFEEFECKHSKMDSFSIGAAHFSGTDRMFVLEILCITEIVNNSNAELDKAKREIRQAETEIEKILSSNSWKIGRVMTWPVRKLKSIVR